MKRIGAASLQPAGIPGINHMRGMQYQIVLNIAFSSEYSCTNVCAQFLHKISTLISFLNSPLVAWVNAVMSL